MLIQAQERYTSTDNRYEKNVDIEKMFVKNNSYVRRWEEHDTSEYRNNLTHFYNLRSSIKFT